MTSLENPLVEAYLQEVADALRAAEPERRNDILEQIADHIVAATEGLEPDDEAGLRAVLDRLGPASEIAAAADLPPHGMPAPSASPFGVPSAAARPTGTSEKWALAALLLSPALCLVGWVVGVVLLWTSRIWTTRHKVVGTIATLPFALMIVLGGAVFVTTGRSTSTVAVHVVTPILAPTSIGQESAPTTATPETRPERPAATDPSPSASTSWTAGRVVAVLGWIALLLVVPIATIIWLSRALGAYLRADGAT